MTERDAVIEMPMTWPDMMMTEDDQKRDMIAALVDQGKVPEQHGGIWIRRVQLVKDGQEHPIGMVPWFNGRRPHPTIRVIFTQGGRPS